MITLKNISMTLDASSIENAVKEMEHFENVLKPSMQYLIDTLAERGVEIAKAHLVFFEQPAYDTGDLYRSVRAETGETDGEAKIYAGEGLTNAMGDPDKGSYAVYVEYGNGYSKPNGWWYPDPEGWAQDKRGIRFSFTNGMGPRPFMQKTYADLAFIAEASGARIIAEYIKGEQE